MRKYDIKQLLLSKSKKELNKVAESVDLDTIGYLKDELCEELSISLVTLGITEEVTITKTLIDKLCNIPYDSIVDEIKALEVQGNAIKELGNEDFNTNKNGEGRVELPNKNDKMLIDVTDMDVIMGMVLAELKTINKNYDFNTPSIVATKQALTNLKMDDRVNDYVFVMTYGNPKETTETNKQNYVEMDEVTLYDEYNKQQIAKREFYINNKLMGQKPTDKQREALNNVLETLDGVENKKQNIFTTIEKLKGVKIQLSATGYDMKVAIEKGYLALSTTPPTKNQMKFVESIYKSGIKYDTPPTTYGMARDFITSSMPMFNRKCLIRELTLQGIHGIDETTIINFNDAKIKDLLYKVKKLNNVLGLCFSVVKMNVWELITKLIETNPCTLLKIQVACLEKDFDIIKEELSRLNR